MKPVFPNESKYSRALFAAGLHLKGTMLSAEATREVCEELVRLAGELLKHPVVTVTIEPGEKRCSYGVVWKEHRFPWCDCTAEVSGG